MSWYVRLGRPYLNNLSQVVLRPVRARQEKRMHIVVGEQHFTAHLILMPDMIGRLQGRSGRLSLTLNYKLSTQPHALKHPLLPVIHWLLLIIFLTFMRPLWQFIKTLCKGMICISCHSVLQHGGKPARTTNKTAVCWEGVYMLVTHVFVKDKMHQSENMQQTHTLKWKVDK